MIRARTVAHALAGIALAGAALNAQTIALSEYAARRAALGALAGDGAVVVLGAPEPLYDHDYFSQSSHLRYLTGWNAPFAALLLIRSGGAQREMLFVPARDINQLARTCDSLLGEHMRMRIVGELEGASSPVASAVPTDRVFMNELMRKHPDTALTEGNALVLKLRGQKSAAEVALLRTSIGITLRAHEEVLRMLTPGWNEFEVQSLVEYTYRRNGADRPGFTTIAGSGDNATTLHYWRNDRVIQAGELMVLDIGASYGGYSADVTRTLPVSGTFSPEQRAIYTLVRAAQQAGEKAMRIGAPQFAPNQAAADVLAEGLAALGLTESATATYDCDVAAERQCPQLRLYYMHGLGHGIGLDVHDTDISDGGSWTAGSVVTIEPGVYVRRNMAEVLPDTPRNRAVLAKISAAVARYAGIGVRIEDDYLLTDSGLEWLSKLPREVSDVERLMQAPRATTPRERDAGLVERYRRGIP